MHLGRTRSLRCTRRTRAGGRSGRRQRSPVRIKEASQLQIYPSVHITRCLPCPTRSRCHDNRLEDYGWRASSLSPEDEVRHHIRKQSRLSAASARELLPPQIPEPPPFGTSQQQRRGPASTPRSIQLGCEPWPSLLRSIHQKQRPRASMAGSGTNTGSRRSLKGRSRMNDVPCGRASGAG